MNATTKTAATKPSTDGATATLNPISLLRAAIKAVPSVRYAFGVVGIAAAVSIAASLLSDTRVAIIGIACALAFMVALLLFQRLSLLENSHFKLPALLLLWFIPVLLMAFLTLLFSSVFFGWPLTLKQWLEGPPRAEAPKPAARATISTFSVTVPAGYSPYLAYRLQTISPDFEAYFQQSNRDAARPIAFHLWPEANLEKILFAIKAGTETSPPTFMTRADFVDELADDRAVSDSIWKSFREIGGALKKQTRAAGDGAAVTRAGQRLLKALPADDGVAGLVVLRHIYYPHQDSAGVTRAELATFLVGAAKAALAPGPMADSAKANERVRLSAYFLATKQLDLVLSVTLTNPNQEPIVLTGVALDIKSVAKSASGIESGPLDAVDLVRFALQGRPERLSSGLIKPIKVAPRDVVVLRVAIRSDLLFSYLCRLQLTTSNGVELSSPDFIAAFGFQPPADAKPI